MDQDKHILELLEDDTILFYSWALGNLEGVGNIFVTVTEKSLKLWDVEFGSKKFSTDFSENVKEFFIVEGN